MPMTQTRRRFLTTRTLAGAASLVRIAASTGRGGSARDDDRAPSEERRHLRQSRGMLRRSCLRAEGFTDIRYVDPPPLRWRRRLATAGSILV